MNVTGRLRRHPLVFVDELDSPRLAETDVDHLVRSLRMSAGDELNLGDGLGRWVTAVLTSITGSVEVTGRVRSVPVDPPTLGVAFAPTKGVKPEAVVRKLTELGIDRIALVRSRRSVVTYDAVRAERVLRRLSVTAREACQQSRHLHLPRIDGVLPLEEVVQIYDHVVLAEPGGPSLWNHVLPAHSSQWVVVGPEGGWTEDERRLAGVMALPGGILRSETAAVAAGVVLAALGEQRRVEK